MPDDRKSSRGLDRERISLSEQYEVRDWCEKFGVTPGQLRAAVKEVGDRADAVEAYLQSHNSQAH